MAEDYPVDSDYDKNTVVSYMLNWLLVVLEVAAFVFTLFVAFKVIRITKCGDCRSVLLVVFVNLTLLSSLILHAHTLTIDRLGQMFYVIHDITDLLTSITLIINLSTWAFYYLLI